MKCTFSGSEPCFSRTQYDEASGYDCWFHEKPASLFPSLAVSSPSLLPLIGENLFGVPSTVAVATDPSHTAHLLLHCAGRARRGSFGVLLPQRDHRGAVVLGSLGVLLGTVFPSLLELTRFVGQGWDRVHQNQLQRFFVFLVLALNVPRKGGAVGLVEQRVHQRVHRRGQVPDPHEHVEQGGDDLLVARLFADDGHDVGDEEGAPHDHEQEEDDAQHLAGLLLVADGLHSPPAVGPRLALRGPLEELLR